MKKIKFLTDTDDFHPLSLPVWIIVPMKCKWVCLTLSLVSTAMRTQLKTREGQERALWDAAETTLAVRPPGLAWEPCIDKVKQGLARRGVLEISSPPPLHHHFLCLSWECVGKRDPVWRAKGVWESLNSSSIHFYRLYCPQTQPHFCPLLLDQLGT